MASLPFVDDIEDLIIDKWIPAKGGKLPEIDKQWRIKELGTGSNKYDEIIISIDSENPQIFSFIKNDASVAENFDYDWLHDISITLDIRTSESENRVLQLTNEVVRICKNNVVPTINRRTYLQLLIEGITPMNEEYRNIFRVMVGLGTLRFNP